MKDDYFVIIVMNINNLGVVVFNLFLLPSDKNRNETLFHSVSMRYFVFLFFFFNSIFHLVLFN